MFRVSVSTTFDAAHRLEGYNGPCSRLHGHTYTVTGEWEQLVLDRIGIALDMVELKKHLRAVVVDMDHYLLNKIRELPKTTAEAIAQLLFKRLSKRVPTGEFLVAVTVEETPGCSVRYSQPGVRYIPKVDTNSNEVADLNTKLDTTEDEATMVAKSADEDGPAYEDDTAGDAS